MRGVLHLELIRSWAIMPSQWKENFLVPMHNGGPPSLRDNYRPIDILCCILKIFERMLHGRFLRVLGPTLDPAQGGYRRGADEQSYALYETLQLQRSQGLSTHCAFVDIKKAF